MERLRPCLPNPLNRLPIGTPKMVLLILRTLDAILYPYKSLSLKGSGFAAIWVYVLQEPALNWKQTPPPPSSIVVEVGYQGSRMKGFSPRDSGGLRASFSD